MSGNGNGSIAFKIITVCIIPILFFMGTSLIANDKEARARDEDVKKELVVCTAEQQKVNQAILVTLAEIKTDLGYIKQKMR